VCICSRVSVELVDAIDVSTSEWVNQWDVLILAGSCCGKRQLIHLIKDGNDLGILFMEHVNHVCHFVILLTKFA